MSEEKFNHIKKKAEIYVNYILAGKTLPDISESKDALCAVCDLIYNENERGGIKSENTDGYSVTFESESDFLSRVYDEIKAYLANTGILYRGIF